MAGDAYTKVVSRSARTSPLGLARLGFMAVLLTVALVLVSGARALDSPPPLTLASISIGDNGIVVTGSVDVHVNAEADLKINGKPVEVDASGDFSAVVDLDAQVLVFAVTSGPGETIKIRIPVLVLLQLGPEDVLDALIDAGISIDIPADGFLVVDGQMPIVSGKILNDDTLASLTINGKDVLRLLGPNGRFSTPAPRSGSRRALTVVATDDRGVSQTSTFAITKVTTVIRTRAGASVSAMGAQGIVIAKVRFDKRNLLTMKRVGVVVTVKDKRGFLIRGAALRLKGMPLRYLANGANRAGFTNRLGKARFMYRLHSRAFAGGTCKHLALMVRASTPRASAQKRVTLRLPTLARG